MLVENSDSVRAWVPCRELLAASGEPSQSSGRGLDLALLAWRVAASLEGRRYGRLVHDLRAEVLAELARALARSGRPRSAAALLAAATRELARGSGDPLLRARLSESTFAALRPDDVDLAVPLLRRGVDLYLRVGEEHAAGRALLHWAALEGRLGRPRRSLRRVVEALRHFDARAYPGDAWWGIDRMLHGLLDLGQADAARRRLAESEALYEAEPDRRARHHWLRGRLATAVGSGERAGSELRRALAGIQGRPVTAAAMKIDLAAVEVERGHRAAAVRRVREAVLAFPPQAAEPGAASLLLSLARVMGEAVFSASCRLRSAAARLRGYEEAEE